MRSRLRGWYQRLRVRWRRHRLTMSYAKVGKARYGLGPLSSLFFAYDRLRDEGLATVDEDGGLEWHWPEDAEGGVDSAAG